MTEDQKNSNSGDDDFSVEDILRELNREKGGSVSDAPEQIPQGTPEPSAEPEPAPVHQPVPEQQKDRERIENFIRKPDVSNEKTEEESTPEFHSSDPEEEEFDLYAKRPPVKKMRAAPSREESQEKTRHHSAFTAIWISVIVLISLLITATIITVVVDGLGIGKEVFKGSDRVLIDVSEGSSVDTIARQLDDNGLVMDYRLFKLFLKVTGKNVNFNYGTHDFTTNMGYDAIIESLEEPAKAEDVEVTIKSGYTVSKIAEILESKGICGADEFKKSLREDTFKSDLWNAIPDSTDIIEKGEGYLFPDTYKFYKNDSPKRVIQKMLDNLESKFTPEMRAAAAARGYTTHQVMTMASIVELEAGGYNEQMPKVAAVFYNRLEQWGSGAFLQSDPTAKYNNGEGKYNTYNNPGLPPGPMCNVSEAAIKAAAYPDETCDALFFVTDSNFNFYYNKTNAEHDATIADLKSRGIWIG